MRYTTSDYVMFRNSMETIVFSYNCVTNKLYFLFYVFKVFKIIESPAPCDVRSVILFFSARNLFTADIYRKICEVYEATAICDFKVRKWVRDFEAGRDTFGWEVLAHSPYSLDLPPDDFHLFYYLKHHFDGNHYNDNEVVKTAVTYWLSEQAASFLEEDIQNPVVR